VEKKFNHPTSQPRYDVAGRYTALLQAGETLLCAGYDKAQPQLIADTAGVSVGLFYRHFKNKQELLTAIMVHHLGTLHQQLAQAVESPSVEQMLQADQAFDTVLVLTLRYFQSHQGLIKLFFMQIGYGDTEATEQLREARQRYRDILLSILENGMEQGIFLSPNVLDTDIAIDSIIGTINWLLYNQLVVKNKDIEPDNLAERISTHLLRGLMKAPPAPQHWGEKHP
jgi:AcrR family transcriptional regulator